MMNAKELKYKLSGQWVDAIYFLAPHLAPAIDKTGRHIPCPIHGGKDGFRLHKDLAQTGGGVCNTCGDFSDGFSLLQWANDWSFKEVLNALDQYLGGNIQNTSNIAPKTKAEIQPNLKHHRSIEALVSQTTDLKGVAEYYLKSRGLNILPGQQPNDLKSIDYLSYWHDGNCLGPFPAMIGIVRNLAGDMVTLHRTYLTNQGYKANVPAPKKLMPPALSGACAGAAIQLYKPTKQLAITEGIETALAVRLSTGLPVWAAISATMLEKVEIPVSVKEVFIMADKDKSGAGERSALKLAKRLTRQHIVRLAIPEQEIPQQEKSIDWLDVYQQETGFTVTPQAVRGSAL